MKNEICFKTHNAAFIALFVLGNAIIFLPVKTANEYTFLAFLAVCVISLGFFVGFSFIVNKFFNNKNGNIIHKIWKTTVLIAVAVYSSFCGAEALKDYFKFISQYVLPDTNPFFIVLLFIGCVFFFLKANKKAILKFSLLAFFFSVTVTLFFFFATAHNYELRNIFIFELPNAKEFIKQAKPYFKEMFFPVVLLPFLNLEVFGKLRVKNSLVGLLAGFLVLGICVMGSVLLFGANLAGRLPFPFASAVSTVTIGRLFTRMDGLSYFIYFVTTLIKTVCCVYIIKFCIKKPTFS